MKRMLSESAGTHTLIYILFIQREMKESNNVFFDNNANAVKMQSNKNKMEHH